jgi:hypothetical protein
MLAFNSSSLEEVFLTLSKKQDEGEPDIHSIHVRPSIMDAGFEVLTLSMKTSGKLCLLGYNAMWSTESVLKFQRNRLCPSSESKNKPSITSLWGRLQTIYLHKFGVYKLKRRNC